MKKEQLLRVNTSLQLLEFFEEDKLVQTYVISTAKNGLGEQEGSECTPRGWHQVCELIGLDAKINDVFVGRVWTGETYSEGLAKEHPGRDWILTRIIRLEGLEPGRNHGGEVDSFARYIYIHGTPDTTPIGIVGSKGCIRMRNQDIIELSQALGLGAKVFIY